MLQIVLVTFFSMFAQAQSAESCTSWERERGIICVFAGKDAMAWKRKCSNEDLICKHRRFDLCLKESLCYSDDPNILEGDCSDWVRNPGVRCYNKGTGKWERAWKRACTIGNLPETLCSDDL